MIIPLHELLFLMSGKGTFLCMSFSYATVVGVEYFRVFFGRERCVLCFCAPKKMPVDKVDTSGEVRRRGTTKRLN